MSNQSSTPTLSEGYVKLQIKGITHMLRNIQMMLGDMSDKLKKVENMGMTLILIIMIYVEEGLKGE
jgi:TRAP-type mannitol/chloroaromatic compound transport system permease small subunit